jgi:hypothetical protein
MPSETHCRDCKQYDPRHRWCGFAGEEVRNPSGPCSAYEGPREDGDLPPEECEHHGQCSGPCDSCPVQVEILCDSGLHSVVAGEVCKECHGENVKACQF